MMIYFPGMVPTSRKPENSLAAASTQTKGFSDRHTTVEDLKDLVRDFVGERRWWDYHTPKNLAASISIEAAELLEHFQWTSPDQPLTDDKRREVGEEMADVLAYLLSLSHVLKIDLAEAIEAKMGKNRRKYPSERFQGNWEKVRS